MLTPGELVDGRYRIEAYLGGGGMASVYRATHVVLEQPVAIKVICPLIRQLPGMAQRFLREARAATQLKSEHVARVTDVGTMADGAPFMVMEYLEGHDLDVLVESEAETTVEDAVDYVLQVCEALGEVHGRGIVHRDLKPANLFLTKGADGLACVKLIDFGISRTDSPLADKDAIALTQPDTAMGSPRYMSPEQMESAATADFRSDIYGIGAVLYELLTKRAPHEGDTFVDIYAAATLGPPVAPSLLRASVPRALDEVILRCLQVDPAARYADIAELAAALAPFGPDGSLGRAEGIARILESSRARTRDGAPEDSVRGRTPSGSSSKIRRRAPSAHTIHRRRVLRVALLGIMAAVAGLVFGGRALYARGEAHGIASAEISAPALAIPALGAPLVAPAPAAPAIAAALPEAGVAATEPAVPASPAPVAPPARAATARVEEPWRAPPPARPTFIPSAAATPRAAPADETTLFEDRK
ncbi:MAG TPA: serine/threonine-protein kinase [Labilithrix sp.]|nr:serine/threonine-protein kinase [Labilithrix sp.]